MASFDQFIDPDTGATHWATYFLGIRYFDNGISYPVIGVPAWCYKCGCLVAAECFMDDEEFNNLIHQLDEIIEGKRNLLSVLIETPEDARREKSEIIDFRAFIAGRVRGACCLQCNDDDIFVLPKMKPGEDVTVPGGPTLRYDTWGFADCGIEPCHYLDREGRKLTEPYDGPESPTGRFGHG